MFELPPPQDDGLNVPQVGVWSRDKYYFLGRYIDAFTTAMHKKNAWSALHYIDLFAGAGIVRLEGSKQLEWGSPLIAAQSPHRFTGLHFCEQNKNRYDALEQRARKLNGGSSLQILHGDANKVVGEIVEAIPSGALSLAFLDPYGLHLHFATLKRLARKRMDLIIFFPDHLDALRNCEFVYHDDPNSNLDVVLGRADWRDELARAPRDKWADVLRRLYCNKIASLGYTQFDFERISLPNGRPLYLLIFCSRSQVAAKIWAGVSSKKPDDQRTFDFGPPR